MRWERKRQAIPLLLFFFKVFFYFIIHLLTLRVKKLRMPPLPTLSLSHPTPSALKRPSFRQCLPGIPAAGRGHTTRGGITTINHQHGPKQILWPRIKHLNITSWLKHPKNLIESLKTTAAANNHPKNPIEYLKKIYEYQFLTRYWNWKLPFTAKTNWIWFETDVSAGEAKKKIKKNWYEICKLQQPKTEQYKID